MKKLWFPGVVFIKLFKEAAQAGVVSVVVRCSVGGVEPGGVCKSVV